MNEKYVAPAQGETAFHCPLCAVCAHQTWHDSYYSTSRGFTKVENRTMDFCEHCHNYAVWIKDQMVYPATSVAPLPADNMPPDVENDYMEARNVVNSSPRAAAALLRLSLQKLVAFLGEKGDSSPAIGNLVKKGLPPMTQESLDCVRVIGNNAVHPGELDLKYDIETTNCFV
jgi:hypothetical protein